MNKKIRILIAEDHTIVRSGLRMLFKAEPDMDVVGEATNGREAIEKTKTYQPDVVLMDITMPEVDGMEATREIKRQWPHIHIIALTMHRSDEYFFEMLKIGASGYLLKGAETDELMDAVRTVAAGNVFLYPTMARKLIQEYLEQSKGDLLPDKGLTKREKEILLLLAEGHSSKDIADKLVLSTSTVHTHRGNIMSKLNLGSHYELMQYARRNGLI